MSDEMTDDLGAAYLEQIEPFRPELVLFAYRMLASVHDAEDAVQETMIRAWRGLPAFEGRSSLRWWLYRIAANVCRDLGSRRREWPRDWSSGGADPTVERDELTPAWTEPLPHAALDRMGEQDPARRHELLASVELAFLVALQHLPVRERGAVILRDVLGFSGAESAGILGTSVAAVNSGLQRARARLAELATGPTQQETLTALDDQALGELVRRYLRAWEHRDLEEIMRLLTEDARYSMPPVSDSYVGAAEIRDFLASTALQERWRFLPAQANGQLAFGTYAWDTNTNTYRASALDVLTLRGNRVCAVTAFLLPSAFPGFGLPDHLGPAAES